MGRKLYGQGIRPSCSYCARGNLSSDKNSVLCRKKGIVPIDFACRRFKYDPLKRIPKIPPELQKFTMEDFSLDI